MLTNTIDRLFQRNPRYDGHGLLGKGPNLAVLLCSDVTLPSNFPSSVA